MKIIWKYLKKYKILLIFNILSAFLISFCEIGIPFVIGDFIIDHQNNNTINYHQLFLIFLILVIFGILGNLLINFCSSFVSSKLFNDLSMDIFKKVQTFSPYEMQKFGISSIMNRNTSDVYQIMSFMSTFYRAAVVAPIIVLCSFIMICRINYHLVFGILFIIPFLIFMIIFMVKKTYYLSVEQQKQLDKLNLITRENLTGFKVVRSLCKDKYEEKRFYECNTKYSIFSIKLFKFLVLIDPIFYFLVNFSIILTIGIGSCYLLPNSNNFTLGNLFKCIEFQFHVLFSILNFLLLFMMFPKTLVSVKRIEEILSYQIVIKNNDVNLKIKENIKKIEFKNVVFNYPNSNQKILDNINLIFYKDEIVSFVGPTGSGKSTLINLIPRLYNVTSGTIKLNDIDIFDYNIDHLRSKIGFVSQKNFLFKGTILSNLYMGKENAPEESILESIKISQSYDFIESKSEKINEFVSEFGNNFSGGQKQRLAIARALVKKPDVYIFDDSFSALDYKTDYELKKAFYEMKKNSIVIIVAQRLSSILNSDKIVVLDQGRILDIGKHKDLIQRCEFYKEIARSQNLLEF
ncbi:MAG: ABC transporter ATP-binding protein [Candidatus Phytoplasma pyri]|uniref:ABC transporter ATP-binding protein n=1 Tax=Candidatus Phytoplasma pyri TaxID=47566 RepID=UPI003982F4B0